MDQLIENELHRILAPVGRYLHSFNNEFFLMHRDKGGETVLLASGSSLQGLYEDFIQKDRGSTCTNVKPGEEPSVAYKVQFKFRDSGGKMEAMLSSLEEAEKFMKHKYVDNPIMSVVKLGGD